MSEWQPIETAPRDGTYILLGWSVNPTKDGEFPKMSVGKSIDRDSGWWLTAGWASSTVQMAPTHWMPLPPPPSEGTPND